jgi:hypothetical protein
MAETWVISEPTASFGAGYWLNAMSSADQTQFTKSLNGGQLILTHNPTGIQESSKKPVFDAETVNGLTIRMTPIIVSGAPLPTVKKLSIKMEQLRASDYIALRLLYEYDLRFVMTTSNYVDNDPTSFSGLARGRKEAAVMDDLNLDWAALRFGQQVYNISVVFRILKNIS